MRVRCIERQTDSTRCPLQTTQKDLGHALIWALGRLLAGGFSCQKCDLVEDAARRPSFPLSTALAPVLKLETASNSVMSSESNATEGCQQSSIVGTKAHAERARLASRSRRCSVWRESVSMDRRQRKAGSARIPVLIRPRSLIRHARALADVAAASAAVGVRPALTRCSSSRCTEAPWVALRRARGHPRTPLSRASKESRCESPPQRITLSASSWRLVT